MAVQWAHLGANQVLVASERGAWLQEPELGTLGLVGAMPDSLPANEETTRQLLDGAIAAAEREAPGVPAPPLTARRWAWHLASQWYCAHRSVELLPTAIERFRATGRPDLASFARHKLEEEQGHDQFPLDDLRALGYDAESLVREIPPAPAVTAGLDYADSCIAGEQPVEFLGYVYALERRVLRLSDDWFRALHTVLPPGIEAASGLRKHATELDADHVNEAVRFVTGLPAEDRTRIAIGCYRTTHVYCEQLPDQDPSEGKLQTWLTSFEQESRSKSPAESRRAKEEHEHQSYRRQGVGQAE
jgi:hypothetical protein